DPRAASRSTDLPCSSRSRPHGCPQGVGRLARAPAVDPVSALSPYARERSFVAHEPDLAAVREHASQRAGGVEIRDWANRVALDDESRSAIPDHVREGTDTRRRAELVLHAALDRMPLAIDPEAQPVAPRGARLRRPRGGDG